MRYAAWFVSEVDAERPPAADVRPTQRLENEVTYCKLDPQQYQRETRAEATQAAEAREEASAG